MIDGTLYQHADVTPDVSEAVQAISASADARTVIRRACTRRLSRPARCSRSATYLDARPLLGQHVEYVWSTDALRVRTGGR